MPGLITVSQAFQVDDQPPLLNFYLVPYNDVNGSGILRNTLAPSTSTTITGVTFPLTSLSAFALNNVGPTDLTFDFHTDTTVISIAVLAYGYYEWDIDKGVGPITGGTTCTSLVVSNATSGAGAYFYTLAYL